MRALVSLHFKRFVNFYSDLVNSFNSDAFPFTDFVVFNNVNLSLNNAWMAPSDNVYKQTKRIVHASSSYLLQTQNLLSMETCHFFVQLTVNFVRKQSNLLKNELVSKQFYNTNNITIIAFFSKVKVLLETPIVSRRKGVFTQHRSYCYEIFHRRSNVNTKAVKKRFNSSKVTL